MTGRGASSPDPDANEGMSSILSGMVAMEPADLPPSSSSSTVLEDAKVPPKALPSLRPATLPSLRPDILPPVSLATQDSGQMGSGGGQGEPGEDATQPSVTVPPGTVYGGTLRRRVSTSGKDL